MSATSHVRYQRQISLPEINHAGQLKLAQARVLCIGAGGLGCAALPYLAAAGVGHIGIVDPDNIELSNLQRQILFKTEDIGQSKAIKAGQALLALNPSIDVQVLDDALTEANVFALINSYDIIIDGSDNLHCTYVLNDACVAKHKPLVFAKINQFQGLCSVFAGAAGPCYRCLFEILPDTNQLPSCAQAGVLGVLPGILGTLQAQQALQWILGFGDSLLGRVLTVDAKVLSFSEFSLKAQVDCQACGQQQPFEKLARPRVACAADNTIPAISMTELQAKRSAAADFTLLDVRQPEEHAAFNIGGALIPLPTLPDEIAHLARDKPIVVYCRTGPRSIRAAELLKAQGFEDVCYLQGGMQGWQAALQAQTS